MSRLGNTRTALTALGAWAAVEPKRARSDNVRAALAFVARGEAPLGIVYRTDAIAEPRVRIVAGVPGRHPCTDCVSGRYRDRSRQ